MPTTAEMIAELMKKNKRMRIFRTNLELAIDDRLIEPKMNGDYSICRDTSPRSDCDWYCFICFESATKMFKCKGCFRVYHESCFASSDEKGKCYFCKTHVQEIMRNKELSVEDINDVIDVFLNNIRKHFFNLIEASWFKNESLTVKNLISKLIHKHEFNFIHIKHKVNNNEYRSVMEFIFDCKMICFKLSVLYGVDSTIGKDLKRLNEFMNAENRFIHSCVDCYISFNHDKIDDDKNFWFIVPCDPPHQICFARTKGFSHYPAKIIRSDMNKSLVWFFDEKHEYAIVQNKEISYTLPKDTVITTKLAGALKQFGMHKLLLQSQLSSSKFDLNQFELREPSKESK
ncbi:zinc finger MYND domain-containing protein 11-like protein [Dinothrombium tinctorium]|uniref:Zinc finger MYND domain-containing protein 11-like protein n=1 Tax=Dinothrombium tinctorium TaxID=1965070 RepID=A0A3S4R1K9_9ACAR|nr:zinc finger MYND domain-containing protein 11-like protein [Dinothrombium tinctorium]